LGYTGRLSLRNGKLLYSTTIYDFVVLPAPHNKKIRTKRVNAYYKCREDLKTLLQNDKALSRWKKLKPISHPCKMKAIVARKSRRNADFDNLGKTVADSLKDAGIIEDDKWIYNGEVIKRIGHHRDYVVVSLYEWRDMECE
jgi:Holliday junction resolvase RusA-like endonuclease